MRHASYWEQDLPPAGTIARALPRRVDVLIVGAGFMGRWLAYFLGRSSPGTRTLVVERDSFSYGASSRNAGFLTCGQISEMLADAASVGVERVIQTFLQRREGIAIARRELPELEVEPCGSTDYDPVTDAGRDLLGKLNAAAGEEIYSVKQARLGNDSRPAYFNAADGALHPVKMLRMLQDKAAGAGFEFGLSARKVADGKAELETAAGRHRLEYGRAYICTNAFAGELDASSKVKPGRGQVIVTSPVKSPTDRTLGYLNQGYDYFRFVDGPSSASGQSRLLIGGGRNRFAAAENGVKELLPTAEVKAYLQGVARGVIGHGEFTVEHHWAGIMGFIGGQHLGGDPRRRLDARTEIIAGFGGMGVALTPLYAQRIAAE